MVEALEIKQLLSGVGGSLAPIVEQTVSLGSSGAPAPIVMAAAPPVAAETFESPNLVVYSDPDALTGRVSRSQGAVVYEGEYAYRFELGMGQFDKLLGGTSLNSSAAREAHIGFDNVGQYGIKTSFSVEYLLRPDPDFHLVDPGMKLFQVLGTRNNPSLPDAFDWYVKWDPGLNQFSWINNSSQHVGEPFVSYDNLRSRGMSARLSEVPGGAALLAGRSTQQYFNSGNYILFSAAVTLNDIGRANGKFEFSVDGVTVLKADDIRYRDRETDVAKFVQLVAMFGGNDATSYSLAGQLDDARLYGTGVVTTPGAPRVSQVYLGGTGWAATFKNGLQARGVGSDRYGYAVPTGSAQLEEVPWSNVNQVSLTFTKDVRVEQNDLSVRGVNVPSYGVNGFTYDAPTRTATWTLDRAVGKDRVLLDLNGGATGVTASDGGGALDGEWINGTAAYPSGNGSAGGNMRFRLNFLAGDVNRDGLVAADDYSAVKQRFFRSIGDGSSGSLAYSIFHDVNASGFIVAEDASAVKGRFFNRLPILEPTVAALLGNVEAPADPLPAFAPTLRHPWEQDIGSLLT